MTGALAPPCPIIAEVTSGVGVVVEGPAVVGVFVAEEAFFKIPFAGNIRERT